MRLGSWITYGPAGISGQLVIGGILGALAWSSCTNIKPFTGDELRWDMNIRKCFGGLSVLRHLRGSEEMIIRRTLKLDGCPKYAAGKTMKDGGY